MNKYKLKIFCDFDGTITQKDLGDEIFKPFGHFEALNSQLVKREIDIKKYWELLWKTIPNEYSLTQFKDFAENALLDPYFIDFVKYIESIPLEFLIVSDGFQLYIEPILKKYKLEHIKYFSNLALKNSNGYRPFFPNADEACECLSASCKRNIVLSNAADDEIIVYIGDGYSDFCCAEHSDIIFAKKNLAAYCNKNKIPHYPYSSFFDIKQEFKRILAKGKFKKRNQAQIKRKNAFEYE